MPLFEKLQDTHLYARARRKKLHFALFTYIALRSYFTLSVLDWVSINIVVTFLPNYETHLRRIFKSK